MSEVPAGVAFKSHEGLRDPFANTPEALAATRVLGRVIPFTLGHLASQLVERGEIQPSRRAVCDYLAITPEELGDSYVYSDREQVRRFIYRQIDRAKVELDPGYRLHVAHIGAELEGYKVTDEEKVIAVAKVERRIDESEATYALQDAVDEQNAGHRMREPVEVIPPEVQRELFILRMKSSALRTGIAAPLSAVLGAALSYEGYTPFSSADIVDAVDDIVFAAGDLDPDLPLSEVTLGQWEIDSFLEGLHRAFRSIYWMRGMKKVDILESLIYTS